MNHTVDAFRALLQKVNADGSVTAIANLDLDTGGRVKRGDYLLADQAYGALLDRITSRPNRAVPEDLKQNILDYYADAVIATDSGPHVNAQLILLRGMRQPTESHEPQHASE